MSNPPFREREIRLLAAAVFLIERKFKDQSAVVSQIVYRE